MFSFTLVSFVCIVSVFLIVLTSLLNENPSATRQAKSTLFQRFHQWPLLCTLGKQAWRCHCLLNTNYTIEKDKRLRKWNTAHTGRKLNGAWKSWPLLLTPTLERFQWTFKPNSFQRSAGRINCPRKLRILLPRCCCLQTAQESQLFQEESMHLHFGNQAAR